MFNLNFKIMRKIRGTLIFILAVFIGFTACNKNKTDEGKGSITFTVGSSLKSTTTSDSSDVSAVIVTIVNEKNQVVVDSKKIGLYTFGSGMISESLQLDAGLYKLTKFFVVDSYDSIVYAAPISGSTKAELVTTPLYIDFTVAENSAVQVTPEVLATTSSNPEDFGYVSFSYSVVEYLTFKVQAYAKDSDSLYSYTSAQLTVRYLDASGDSLSYSSLTATLQAMLNSVDVRKVANYQLIFSKTGYNTIYKTYSADSLIIFYNSPMSVYFTSSSSVTPTDSTSSNDSIPSTDTISSVDSAKVFGLTKHKMNIVPDVNSIAAYFTDNLVSVPFCFGYLKRSEILI
jgi:hypothetical protein